MDMEPRAVRHSLLRDVAEGFSDIATVIAATPYCESKVRFFAVYDKLICSSVQARRRIFEDPRMVIWVASAESAILEADGCVKDESTITKWARELDIFALSAALIDGSTYETNDAWLSAGSTFLPGARQFFRSARAPHSQNLSLDAHGIIRVDGSPIELMTVLESRGVQLVTADRLLTPPDVPGVVPLAPEEVDVGSWVTLLDKATDLIALHTDSMDLSRLGSAIVPVQGAAENTHCSVSFSTRPCVLYMSWAPSAKVIAEAIVHESDHQLFYVLTRRHSFWTEPVINQRCVFRSPWRDDPRPLDGLLRGASAFIRVGEFWCAVLPAMTRDSEDFHWTGRRSVLAVRQALDALSLIDRFGSLSAAGRELVTALLQRAQRVLEEISHESEFPSWKALSIEQEAVHDDAWRLRHRAVEKDRIEAE